jgi:hypothetical protein
VSRAGCCKSQSYFINVMHIRVILNTGISGLSDLCGAFRFVLHISHIWPDTLSGPAFEFRQRREFSVFTTASRPALGPSQPPVKWVLGVLTPGLKRPGCETDHSHPSITEVKNTWNYTSTPHTSSCHGA